MKIPNGREAVNEFYGNPSDGNGHLSSAWENANIVSITLPYPMRLAWDKSVMVSRIRVHHLAATAFLAAFNAVWLQVRMIIKERDGYDETTAYYDAESRRYLASKNLDLYGGAFNFRAIRGAYGLSMHSYGIAIDIDPDHNPLGATKGTLPDWFIKCWKDAGFFWGGDFAHRKDIQHFQLAEGV